MPAQEHAVSRALDVDLGAESSEHARGIVRARLERAIVASPVRLRVRITEVGASETTTYVLEERLELLVRHPALEREQQRPQGGSVGGGKKGSRRGTNRVDRGRLAGGAGVSHARA